MIRTCRITFLAVSSSNDGVAIDERRTTEGESVCVKCECPSRVLVKLVEPFFYSRSKLQFKTIFAEGNFNKGI